MFNPYTTMFSKYLFISLGLAISTQAATTPPLLGPVLPYPREFSGAPEIQSAAADITSLLKKALTTGKTPWNTFTPKGTSVSVQMWSAFDDEPFFTYDFTGDNLNTTAGSVTHVDHNTLFRIGSVSKLFTTYALLLNSSESTWTEPVTNFIPELQKFTKLHADIPETDRVLWDQVKVDDLASQMAGVPRDCTSHPPSHSTNTNLIRHGR